MNTKNEPSGEAALRRLRPPPTAAGVMEFVVRESCGRDWTNELLSFPVEYPRGRQAHTRLVFHGPGGVVPTQISDAEHHADGSLARAVASCRVNLGAGRKLMLCLKPGDSPAPRDRLIWRAERSGMIEAGNSRFAVKVPVSGTYPGNAAPGPVAAIRIGKGEWLGQGTLRAGGDVVMSTELLDRGPLFLRWSTRACYGSRPLVCVECAIQAGEDFVRIREETSRDSDMTFALDCFPGLRPDRLLTEGGGEHMEQQVRVISYARPETMATVDFHSGHHQMSLSWCGVYREGAEPFIGIVELNGAEWTNLALNRIHVVAEPSERLEIVSPLRGGVKEWALVCSTTRRNLKRAGSRVCNHLSRIHQRYAEVPLQKVKDWVLEWDDEKARRPLLQCDTDGIARARAKVKADPELARVYRAWAEALESKKDPKGPWGRPPGTSNSCATLWVALGERRFAERGAELLEKEIRVSVDRFWKEGAYMRLLIFDGRRMKMWLQAYDVLKAGGFIRRASDRNIRRDLAFLAYCFADPEFFPDRVNLMDHEDPDSFFHGLGERWGDTICPPNFQTEYYTTYGMTGCTFPSHPHAAAWREKATAMFDRQLAVHYYDSGGYCESPNYHSHSFIMLNQLALALRRGGDRDFYQHPRFKAQFDWFCRMQTPPILLNEAAKEFVPPWRFMDPDRERYAMLPGNGNTGHDCSDMPLPVELAIGGVMYRESDPALSGRCMTTWRRAGRPTAGHYDDLTFLLVADPSLPGPERLGLASRLLTGNYVTFRGKPETDDEVFVLTKNGTATHHNDFDEGGFTIWAYGSPIAGDFGYHAHHEGKGYGGGDTWKHNCVEFDRKSSGFLGIEHTSPPEKFVSTDLADLLVSHIPINNLRDFAAMGYAERIPVEPPIEYRRYTLFVKPHYLLIYDSLLTCRCAHRWWLHAQADSVTVEGTRVRFGGRFGVDLVAQFIEPAAPAIATGAWSVMKHIYATQALAHDWRVFVAPVRPGQEFTVTYSPDGRRVQVATPEYEDTIFLAHFPFAWDGRGVAFRGRAAVVRASPKGRVVEKVLLDGDVLKTS
jgi:hypothetical protein